jgi:hypothetical protein
VDKETSPQLPAISGAEPGTALRYIKEDEFPAWDALVEASPQGSLFCLSWWLKAIGEDIGVLGYFDKKRLVAGIPLYFDEWFGVKPCAMPKLTQTWGVVIEPLIGKPVNRASREMHILKLFAQELQILYNRITRFPKFLAVPLTLIGKI